MVFTLKSDRSGSEGSLDFVQEKAFDSDLNCDLIDLVILSTREEGFNQQQSVLLEPLPAV